GGVAAEIIGADHEHDDLGLDALQLAVLEPPQDVLSAIAADAEVGRLERDGLLLEDLAAGALAVPLATPGIGDRIAQKEHVDATALGDLDELGVAALVLLRRRDGTVRLPLVGNAPPCEQANRDQNTERDAELHSFPHASLLW